MARGKKTGGRDWKKGEGGRPKGARDKHPRACKASIRRLLEELVLEQEPALRKAILAGVKAGPPKSFPYIQLAAYYLDGKPKESVAVEGEMTIRWAEKEPEP